MAVLIVSLIGLLVISLVCACLLYTEVYRGSDG